MEISVVIATRNRAEQLGRCLESLSRLRYDHSFELVIVDNGSTDETPRLVAELKNSSTFPLKMVTEPIPGLGRARNSGWRAASGRIIAFTDDDCYPAEDWLTAIHTCFAENGTLAFLGGRILLHDPTDGPITIQLLDRKEVVPPGSFVPAGLIQGANFSFTRQALEAVGGFDPLLGAGTPFGCEDVEILARLSGSSFAGAYDPRPRVYHHHGRKTDAELTSLMKGYDYGRGAYYMKCILDPALRTRYLRSWLRAMTRQARMMSLRELSGALRYLGYRFRAERALSISQK